MMNAYFAGGCFWCVEHDLREIHGVIDIVSGYAGGEGNPSYENHRGFREAVEVSYDESQVDFKKLCQFFLDHIDPTDEGGQFFDRGESYKTAIYFSNSKEEDVAKSLLNELEASKLYDENISVDVLPLDHFYKAEEYHQRYAEKNPEHYEAYRKGSGRSDFQVKVCLLRDQKKMNWKE